MARLITQFLCWQLSGNFVYTYPRRRVGVVVKMSFLERSLPKSFASTESCGRKSVVLLFDFDVFNTDWACTLCNVFEAKKFVSSFTLKLVHLLETVKAMAIALLLMPVVIGYLYIELGLAFP